MSECLQWRPSEDARWLHAGRGRRGRVPDPAHATQSQPERGVIPLEWKDDQRKLRDALYDDLLACYEGIRTPGSVTTV